MTRARLVDVSERLIAERGVAGVSIREIAAAAGQANHSAVRHHFQSKESLVRHVLIERAIRIEMLRAQLLRVMPSPLTKSDAVVGIVLPFVDHLHQQKPTSYFFRFVEQASRHFGGPSADAEIQAQARAFGTCVSVLMPGSNKRGDRAVGFMGLGMILRSLADREQAQAEGRVLIADDWEYAAVLVGAAQRVFGVDTLVAANSKSTLCALVAAARATSPAAP